MSSRMGPIPPPSFPHPRRKEHLADGRGPGHEFSQRHKLVAMVPHPSGAAAAGQRACLHPLDRRIEDRQDQLPPPAAIQLERVVPAGRVSLLIGIRSNRTPCPTGSGASMFLRLQGAHLQRSRPCVIRTGARGAPSRLYRKEAPISYIGPSMVRRLRHHRTSANARKGIWGSWSLRSFRFSFGVDRMHTIVFGASGCAAKNPTPLRLRLSDRASLSAQCRRLKTV
jgi:hypothetical protein